jgi:hypothetical protein
MLAILSFLLAAIPAASAQSQYVVATPGYINLGMTTAVVVTSPSAGSFNLVVEKPNGSQSTVSFIFGGSGQVQNATYGNATAGFMSTVDQVGTYNVYLEQGSTVVSSTSFYATNKFQIHMDMVDGGTCAYIPGATRGTKLFPRFYITYASNGAKITNLTPGATVTYTTPDGTVVAATWDRFVGLFVGKVQPNWNYTAIGPWNPSMNVSDAAGNQGSFQYTGSPFVISPVELDTQLNVVDPSGNAVTGLYNGQSVTIEATIFYPTNAEPVPGFVAPLNASRGGAVTAQVGWGYYNVTSGTFGGSSPGALLGTVLMSYSTNGTWTGQFLSNSLPALQGGSTYEVVVSAKDAASPANVGFAMENLAPATQGPTTTQTTTAVSTVVSTVATTTTQNVVETVQAIPDLVYASLAILLILGVVIGYIVRVPR